MKSKPTKYKDSTFRKLFEDGDYYITDAQFHSVGYGRNSVIIHQCPDTKSIRTRKRHASPFNMTITLPGGEGGECYYCGQVPSDDLIAVYKLHNFDHFANDVHERIIRHPMSTNTIKFPRRNG